MRGIPGRCHAGRAGSPRCHRGAAAGAPFGRNPARLRL